MAHLDEPMDIDDMDLGFDNKENTFRHSNVLRNACTEKGYEELDVSELNMKLRYSVTPASSPLSKSCIANSNSIKSSEIEDTLSKTLINENSHSINFSNSSITNRDTTFDYPTATPPHELHFDHSSGSRNISVLQPLDSTVTVDCIITDGLNNSDENFSFPSSLSSTAHTSESTTPTKDIPKIESRSPIMRGLKSVLNMFRSSQSPIPPESENKLQIDSQNNLEICSPQNDIIHESGSVNILASTPIASHRNKESQSKGNSPHKDSVVFNDDLEKELLWKDETTIIFSKEKIPIHKLFLQQPKPSNLNSTKNENKNHNANESINSTVEYMDISNNSTIKDKTKTDILVNESDVIESDSEFQDCETTFTKTEDLPLENKAIELQLPVESKNEKMETKSGTGLAKNTFNKNKYSEQKFKLGTDVSKSFKTVKKELENELSDTKVQSKILCESQIPQSSGNKEVCEVNKNSNVECCEKDVKIDKILNEKEKEYINRMSKTDIITTKTKILSTKVEVQDITNSVVQSSYKPAYSEIDNVLMHDMHACKETDIDINTSKNNVYSNMNVVQVVTNSDFQSKSPFSEKDFQDNVPMCDLQVCTETGTDINTPKNNGYSNVVSVQDMTKSESQSPHTSRPACSEIDIHNNIVMCDMHACTETVTDANTSKNNVCSNMDEVQNVTNSDLHSKPASAETAFQDNVPKIDMHACTETDYNITSNLIPQINNKIVVSKDSANIFIAEDVCSTINLLQVSAPETKEKENNGNKESLRENKNNAIISFSDVKSEIMLNVKDINMTKINDVQYLSDQNYSKSGDKKELYVSEEEIESNLDLNLFNATFVTVLKNKCAVENNKSISTDIKKDVLSDKSKAQNLINSESQITHNSNPEPNSENNISMLGMHTEIENIQVTSNLISDVNNIALVNKDFMHDIKAQDVCSAIGSLLVSTSVNENEDNHKIKKNFESLSEITLNVNPIVTCFSNVKSENICSVTNANITKMNTQFEMDQTDCKLPSTKVLSFPEEEIDSKFDDLRQKKINTNFETIAINSVNNNACENYKNATAEDNDKNSINIDIKMDVQDRPKTLSEISYISKSEPNYQDNIGVHKYTKTKDMTDIITFNLIPNVDTITLLNTDFINNVTANGACPQPSLHVESEVLHDVEDTVVTNINKTQCLIDQTDHKSEKTLKLANPEVDSTLEKLGQKNNNGDNKIAIIDPAINNDCKNNNHFSTQVIDNEADRSKSLTVTSEEEETENHNVLICQLGKSAGELVKQPDEETENQILYGSTINSENNSNEFHQLKRAVVNVVTDDVDSGNSFEKKSKIAISPPVSCKGYKFEVDGIKEPFATKSNLNMSSSAFINHKSSELVSTKYTAGIKEQSLENNIIDTEKLELDSQKSYSMNIGSQEKNDTVDDSSAANGFSSNTCYENSEAQLKNISSSISSLHDSSTRSIPTSKNVFNLPEIQDVSFSQSLIKSKHQFVENKPEATDTFAARKLEESIISTCTKDIKHEIYSLDHESETTYVLIEQPSVLGNQCLDSSSEIAHNYQEHVANASHTTSSSKTTEANITVQEIHTDNEDTVEGPFLEAEDLILTNKITSYGRESDLMQFTDLPHQENVDAGEFFIDAEAYEFLLNKNNDEILEHGKESLFLKFDPLFARRLTSEGVAAVLNDFKRRQSTPKKNTKIQPRELKNTELTYKESSSPDHSMTNVTQSVLNCTAEESTVDLSATTCKPTMAVSPAVNPVLTPRNMPSNPSKVNRHSLTFTSPAMTVIDKLLSLSPKNNSIVTETKINAEQNEATQALIQLREVLSEKVLENQQIKSESKELRSRLTTLESQIKVLEDESDDRLKKIKTLNEQLTDKTKMNKTMSTVVEEYEKAIATLISETEQEKKLHAEERVKLITERNEQTAHLASMEVSFNDLHSKYEKSKQIIISYKASEDNYKKSLKEFDESCAKLQSNYDLLKQHATSKLNQANEELKKINRAHNSEVLKLNAMIKRKELFITSIEENLAQKTKANEELTAICDELINKVG